MPHVHGVDILDRKENRILARIEARWGWLPVRLECGFEHDDERMVMHRWYRGCIFGGIVESWRVAQGDDDLVEVRVAIRARGWLKRFIAAVVIAPIAARQLEMIDLLATADRQARERDVWE